MARINIAENESYKNKLNALQQYQKFERENTGAKEKYNKAVKEQNKKEFLESPVGRASSLAIGVGRTILKPQKVNIKQARFIQRGVTQPQVILTKEQSMLQQLFNGERTFGTGQNLPVINNALNSGEGIVKNGDYERKTGKMFGLK